MNKQRIKALIAEYGRVALYTYVGLFLVSMTVFAIGLSLGFDIQGAGAGVGVIGGAWLASKAIQPLRIAATLLLTPFIARVLQRFGRKPVTAAAEQASDSQ